jgi:hypothetical protein
MGRGRMKEEGRSRKWEGGFGKEGGMRNKEGSQSE